MKKLLIAFSMISAGALVACADAQSNSVTTNYASQAWFSASVPSDQIVAVGGTFKAGSESTVTPKENKIEFDSELEDPITFELDSGNNKTCNLVRVSFDLEASVVPYNALPKSGDAGFDTPKLAFALSENQGKTATNFCAWANGDWQTLTALDGVVPAVDNNYTLVMRFDDSATDKKVQFTVTNGTASATSEWLAYAGLAADSATKIDFAGCGKMTSMNAVQVRIVSAKVVITGGSVTIAEEDAEAMGKLVTGEYTTIEQVLAAPAKSTVTGGSIAIADSCTLSTAEAYAIGLIANEGDTMVAKADGTFKVQADATAAVTDSIPVKFADTLVPATGSGATIKYQLEGSANGTGGWVNVGGEKSDQSEISIPTADVGGDTGKYRYFRVKTTVTLEGASK